MDYYQGVVLDYLRCDRAMFVNPECTIQLHDCRMPAKNEFWYCDAVALNMREHKVFLCEITYAVGMTNLIKRLKAWNDNWESVCAALERDCGIDRNWQVHPWVFVPEHFVKLLTEKMRRVVGPVETWSFKPLLTTLETVQPWRLMPDARIKGEVRKRNLESAEISEQKCPC